ncbi:hypothetical protein [Marinimicrobium sp. C2-29]|uniref:hypothetical protein n=1 Tax=Marinimicrobium sp. C2-29 TaxID=3139825 RepID=UPI003139C493
MRNMSIVLIVLVGLAGCVAQPDIKELRDDNQELERRLSQASDEISELRVSEQRLLDQLDERERLIGVLETEKSSRTQDASELRSSIRAFIESQIDSYQSFLLQADLLDYIGGELVERANGVEESRTLVDLDNPIPDAGTLTGVAAHFLETSSFKVKVLRPVDDQWVVIWESMELTVEETGRQRISFPVSVGVERGDVIAYWFSGPVPISYDLGTGDTRYLREDLAVGSTLETRHLSGAEEGRAYSVGVVGLLN